MINFAEVKERFSFAAVIDKLGLKLVHYNDQWRGQCPECRGGDRSLVITEAKGFTCFDSQKRGDQISLVSHIRQMSPKDAAEWIDAQAPKEPEKPTGFNRDKYEAALKRDHELLKDLDPDLIKRAGIGVSPKGSLAGLINVPIYDKETRTFLCFVGVLGLKLPKTIK